MTDSGIRIQPAAASSGTNGQVLDEAKRRALEVRAAPFPQTFLPANADQACRLSCVQDKARRWQKMNQKRYGAKRKFGYVEVQVIQPFLHPRAFAPSVLTEACTRVERGYAAGAPPQSGERSR
jgi:hypothetical protein